MNKKVVLIYDKIKTVLPFMAFGVLILIMHWLIQGWEGDDYYYSEILNTTSYKEFLYNNYYYHSSRLIVDSLVAIVLHISMNLWKILDVLIFASFPLLAGKILNIKITQNSAIMLCAVFMLYPFYVFSECGWAVTTMYYFWVIMLGMLSIYYSLKVIRNGSLKWYETVICILASIVACNMEQINLILFLLYFSLLVYQIIKRRTFQLFAVQFVIAVGELIFSLTSPGHNERIQAEIASSLVDYKMLSVLDKIQLGYATTVYKMMDNIFFLLLCILLCIYVIKKSSVILYRVISIIPVVTCLAVGYLENILVEFIPGIDRIKNALGHYGVVDLSNFDIRSNYIPLVMFGMVCACVLCSILVIYNNEKGMFINIVIIAGFLSRVAMGFSPTLYKSGKRTFIPFTIILVLCDCLIMHDMLEEKVIGNRFKYLLISLAGISFMCTLSYMQ